MAEANKAKVMRLTTEEISVIEEATQAAVDKYTIAPGQMVIRSSTKDLTLYFDPGKSVICTLARQCLCSCLRGNPPSFTRHS